MFNQSLFTYLVRAMVLLTAIPIHECAHALAASSARPIVEPCDRRRARVRHLHVRRGQVVYGRFHERPRQDVRGR